MRISDWSSDVCSSDLNGNVNPLGLYDLDRNIRAVGRAYKESIAAWREVLPAQSLCLAVPIVPPSHWDRIDPREKEAEAADRLRHEPPEQSMQANGRCRSGGSRHFMCSHASCLCAWTRRTNRTSTRQH